MNKTNLIVLCVGIFLGLCTGFFTGKALYDKPIVEKVERDTITIHDTVPDYHPVTKDSVLVKWMTVRVPMEGPRHSRDTVYQTDTIEVELPVTQKHYLTESYQAWVSGYRPALDSIEIYQKEKIVTETITVTQQAKKKHWGIGFNGGYGYDFNTKTAAPFFGVGISYNLITF